MSDRARLERCARNCAHFCQTPSNSVELRRVLGLPRDAGQALYTRPLCARMEWVIIIGVKSTPSIKEWGSICHNVKHLRSTPEITASVKQTVNATTHFARTSWASWQHVRRWPMLVAVSGSQGTMNQMTSRLCVLLCSSSMIRRERLLNSFHTHKSAICAITHKPRSLCRFSPTTIKSAIPELTKENRETEPLHWWDYTRPFSSWVKSILITAVVTVKQGVI